jgi:biopolymer transport protein ExbD
VRFTSPVRRKHARIEIIPLIDIMFFLLASFMLVSLNMTKVENIRVDPPSAKMVDADFPPEMIHVAVDKTGGLWVEKKPITLQELFSKLTNSITARHQVPIYIGGDAETRHGDMVTVLELVRKAGVQKVSFTVAGESTPNAPKSGG